MPKIKKVVIDFRIKKDKKITKPNYEVYIQKSDYDNYELRRNNLKTGNSKLIDVGENHELKYLKDKKNSHANKLKTKGLNVLNDKIIYK